MNPDTELMGVFYGISNVAALSGLGFGRHFVMQEPSLTSTVLKGTLPSRWATGTT